jgi:tripartite ATP-independent transporter DctP family solute receptor
MNMLQRSAFGKKSFKGALVLLVAVLVFVLAGCGGSGSSSGGSGGSSGQSGGASTGGTSGGSSGGGSKAPADDKTYTIRISYHVPESHSAHQASEQFKQLVEERSGGRLKVELYPGGVLGGLRDNTEGVAQGILEMAWTDLGSASVYYPKSGVISLPFLFRDYDHVEKFFDGEVGQKLKDDVLQASGIRFLAMVHSGFRSIVSTKAINSVDDMKNLKLRVPEIPLYTNFAKLLGAAPTPIPSGEIYTSIQTGVVDAAELPANTMYDLSLHEVGKYITHTYHIYTDYDLAINDKFYQSLPQDLQQIISDAAQEVATETRKLVREQITDYEKKLEASLTKTEVNRDDFKNKMGPLYDEFAQQNDAQQLIDDILNIK